MSGTSFILFFPPYQVGWLFKFDKAFSNLNEFLTPSTGNKLKSHWGIGPWLEMETLTFFSVFLEYIFKDAFFRRKGGTARGD